MSLRILIGSCVAAGVLTACNRQAPADDHTSHMAPGDVSQPPVTPSNSQGDMSLPASAMHSAARLANSPRHGEWVKVAWEPGSKDSLMAWIVYPSTNNAKSPVVVVVHEIYGLSSKIAARRDAALP